MPRFLDQVLSPKRVRNFQDGAYALLVLGVTASLMLFLVGSADILSSLTIIGVLLCLSLVGGILRFFSMTRTDNELFDRQNALDQTLSIIQHRVGDHDLTLLKMAGQIETLETGLRAVRLSQHHAETRQQAFMNGMKDRMFKLVTVLTRSRHEKNVVTSAPGKGTAKQATPKKSFFPPLPAVNANPVPPASGTSLIKINTDDSSAYDDDVYISPTLMRSAIETAIKSGRIDAYLQPIVALPQQKTVGYDVYGRVRFQPGVYIPARQYRGAATHAGNQVALDRLVLSQTVALAHQVGPALLFVNLTIEGLTDPGTLSILAAHLRKNSGLKTQIVLSVSQKDLGRLTPRAESVITQLVQMGVKCGVNDVQNAEIDMNLLARLKFSYLKLAHNKLVTTRDSDNGAALIHRFLTRLQARNITLIAGQVSTRDDLRPLLDYPITLAQGHAFARPDRPVTFQKRAA